MMMDRDLSRLLSRVKDPEPPVIHSGTWTSHLTALHPHFFCSMEAILLGISASEDSCKGPFKWDATREALKSIKHRMWGRVLPYRQESRSEAAPQHPG